MKKIEYILGIAAIALSMVACTSKEQNYTPTPAYPGDNVYFPNDYNTTVDLEQGATEFTLPILRNETSKDAIDVPLIAVGDAIDGGYISVPGTVSFAAGQTEAAIVISVDSEKLGLNNTVSVTIAIADESAIMPYGDDSITLGISIPLPWQVFDTGILTESPGWWGETEAKTLYYQEISSTLWLCKLPQCWGHDTIAGGEEYDCQDYMFYWDKETDYLYICYGYMGFTDGGVPIYVGTKADYYIAHYYNTGDSSLSPEDIGTNSWFAAQDYYLDALYGPEDRPHYDGNGGFYLGDSYLCDQIMEGGAYEGYAETMADDPDTFICDSFVRLDFTTEIEYTGMFVDPDGNASAILSVTAGQDAKGIKFVNAPEDKDPIEVLYGILDGTGEGIGDAELVGVTGVKLDGVQPGIYNFIAVPYDEGGALQADYAVLCNYYFPGVSAEKPEVEGFAKLLNVSDVYTPEEMAGYELDDVNYMAYAFVGTDISSVAFVLGYSDSIDQLIGLGYTEEFIIDNAGSVLPEKYVAYVNDGGFINAAAVSPDVEYELLVKMTNKYGSSKIFKDFKTNTSGNERSIAKNTMADGLVSYYADYKQVIKAPFDMAQGWGQPSHKVLGGKKSKGISKIDFVEIR